MILLECNRETLIEHIHHSTHLIEQVLKDELQDIVPAYYSIAIFTSLEMPEMLDRLDGFKGNNEVLSEAQEIIELPICYEAGLDLSRVAGKVGISEDEIIKKHLEGIYRSLFIGFTPGFIYADGLNESLACPRLENPRKQIPSGSVGIAGNQTGIYSLASPGGWNIIGRTPSKIFDPERNPPMMIGVGDQYRFYRITKEEFEGWEN